MQRVFVAPLAVLQQIIFEYWRAPLLFVSVLETLNHSLNSEIMFHFFHKNVKCSIWLSCTGNSAFNHWTAPVWMIKLSRVFCRPWTFILYLHTCIYIFFTPPLCNYGKWQFVPGCWTYVMFQLVCVWGGKNHPEARYILARLHINAT